MNLIIVSSAYQLLNAILIAKKSKRDFELMLIRRNLVDSCDIDVLKDLNFFKKVYIWGNLQDSISDEKVKTRKDKLKRYQHLTKAILNKKKILAKLPNKEIMYEVIFVGYADFVSRLICSYFVKRGSSIGLFDEGTYTYRCLEVEKSLLRKIANQVVFGGDILDSIKIVYVREPKKLNSGNHKHLRIYKIDSDYQAEKKEIFAVYKMDGSGIDLFNRPVVCFDQNLEMSTLRQRQSDIVSECVNVFGKNNVMVKLHPSSRKNGYESSSAVFKGRAPFEILMDAFDFNNKLLVSVFSSTCFAPKEELNQEPFVMFTFNLMGNDFHINPEYLRMVDDLRDEYNQKDRIFVPKSKEEMLENLRHIKDVMVKAE